MSIIKSSLTRMQPHTAIVLDDHVLYAESFASLLERLNTFQHVYTLYDEEQLPELIAKLNPDNHIFLFADYYMGDGRYSSNIINDLKRLYKNLLVIMVSFVTSPIMAETILNYKIDGFLHKSSDPSEIITCINSIMKKDRYVSPVITKMLHQYVTYERVIFSEKEIEILGYFAQGFTVKATAAAVHLSHHTIVMHRRRMMAKTHTNTITELLAYARKIDLI